MIFVEFSVNEIEGEIVFEGFERRFMFNCINDVVREHSKSLFV